MDQPTCESCTYCFWVAQSCPPYEAKGECRISPPSIEGFPKVKLKFPGCGSHPNMKDYVSWIRWNWKIEQKQKSRNKARGE
jgi:hypothetical protein